MGRRLNPANINRKIRLPVTEAVQEKFSENKG